MKQLNYAALLDKKRFDYLEKQRISNLRKLTTQKSIKIMENLLNSGIIEEYKKASCKKTTLNNGRRKFSVLRQTYLIIC